MKIFGDSIDLCVKFQQAVFFVDFLSLKITIKQKPPPIPIAIGTVGVRVEIEDYFPPSISLFSLANPSRSPSVFVLTLS